VVAVALLNDRGEVLMARRTKRQTFAGMWEFPGGKVCLLSCTAHSKAVYRFDQVTLIIDYVQCRWNQKSALNQH
jgi:hypothetical protein